MRDGRARLWLAGDQFVVVIGASAFSPAPESVTRLLVGPSGSIIPIALNEWTVYFEPHRTRPEVLSISIKPGQGSTFARWTISRGWNVLLKTPTEFLNAIPDPQNPDLIYLTSRSNIDGWKVFDASQATLAPTEAAIVRERVRTNEPRLVTEIRTETRKPDLLGDVFSLQLLEEEREMSARRARPQPEGKSREPEFPTSMHLGFAYGPGWLNPDQRMVAMPVPGGIAIKSILVGDLQALRDAKLAALRTAALSDSKMVALAIIMWMADNDDAIPGPEHHPASFTPYSKDASLLQKFVFTCQANGKLAGVADPSTVELGYVPGPGGRAVAYLDGHVKWVPDVPAK